MPPAARRNPLRRYREFVCLLAGVILWVAVLAAVRDAYSGTRGRRLLLADALVEATGLGVLFYLEHRRRRPAMGRRWITIAWASLPVWASVELALAGVLRATG